MSHRLPRYFLLIICLIVLGLGFYSCGQGSITAAGHDQKNITDVSKGATLSVNHENPGGSNANEGSSKLLDGDKYTKFLIFDYSPDFYAEQTFDSTVTINAYTVTAGNDAPNRDAKNWTLEGSNDGSTWETLDTQNDATFDLRNKTNIYHLDADASYQYFRFNVTANVDGGGLLQISEWRLLYYSNQN